MRRRRIDKPSATIRRFAIALKSQPGHMFGNIVHRNLFASFNDPSGDIVPVGAMGVRIAGVIDEPRWRLHEDVVTVDDGKESPLFRWKSIDRFIAQYLPAPINDDFAQFDASCRKHSPSVNWGIMYDDFFHVPRPILTLVEVRGD